MNAANPERWQQLWRSVAKSDDAASRYAELIQRYAEPQRNYHNLQHIGECLNEFDAARQLARDATAVELAIWFHDAIYDSRAPDNEERSAALAVQWLAEGGAASKLCADVSQLVMATKTHDAALHPDAALLVDVDLSILGKAPDRFWEYETQIREEYHWVPETVFAVKRAEVLRNFLGRPRIYNTPLFFEKYETAARENLVASIQKLAGG